MGCVMNRLAVLDFRITMMHMMLMIAVTRNPIDFDAVIFARVSASEEQHKNTKKKSQN